MYIRAFKLQYLLFKIAQLVQLSDNNASLASIFASEFNDLNIFVSVITSLSAQKAAEAELAKARGVFGAQGAAPASYNIAG